MNSFVLRDERRIVSAGMGDDEPIKRIACPSLIQRMFNNSRKGKPADRQSDFSRQPLDYLERSRL